MRSDANLHRVIFEHCGNRRLLRAREGTDTYVRWLSLPGTTGIHRVLGSSRRHMQIVEAMWERDPRAARDFMELHTEEVKTWIMEELGADGITPSEEIARTVREIRERGATR